VTITLESTAQAVRLDGIDCRRWQGRSDQGAEFSCYTPHVRGAWDKKALAKLDVELREAPYALVRWDEWANLRADRLMRERNPAEAVQVRIESNSSAIGRHRRRSWQVIADFNGVQFRSQEYATESAAMAEARKAFPGWAEG
jgi:hypothetical protein